MTTARAFALSLTYVLGMALTYTIAGTAFAALGGQAPQAAFQQPWIVALLRRAVRRHGAVDVGFFTVQMPAALQTRIANLSNRQTAGTLGGVAVMGALSALLVTTCVGPALVAALAVISQTGEIARGAAALFAMSHRHGHAAAVIGTSAGRLLPKAGPWMDTIKRLFGAVMLGVAVWMLGRVAAGARDSGAVGRAGGHCGSGAADRHPARSRSSRWPLRLGGLGAGCMGSRCVTGAALGGTNPLAPIPAWAGAQHRPCHSSPCARVADLDRQVAQAARAGPAGDARLLCRLVHLLQGDGGYHLPRPGRAPGTAGTVLLRADVTANDARRPGAAEALRHLSGRRRSPSTAAMAEERPRYRVVGYMNGAEFAAAVRAAVEPSQPAS